MNAACEQYATHCQTLPMTGFQAVDWVLIGLILLFAGVWLAARLYTDRYLNDTEDPHEP